MTLETARYLLSEQGKALLEEADALREQRAETLAALMRLRRSATPDLAAAAWEMSDLRRRGVSKFGPPAARMYFQREALEQASGARAAAYHAARFVQAGVTAVADLCGGIGGDALAFAAQGLRVTLYELDPVRALYARANAAVHGLEENLVVEADVTAAQIDEAAVWFDPARRQEKRRVTDPEDYAPPLALLHRLAAQGITDIGVKLSPAIDHALAAQYDAGLEFVSDGGECKEALLWRGALKTENTVRATKLTETGAISLSAAPDAKPSSRADDDGGRFLYEPDPAVIRAHLVQTLAAQLSAAPIHPQIAYLIGDERVGTPWATAYEIVERLPYSRRRLQAALTALAVGRVVIKKRGFPQEPDEVRKQLKLKGEREMTVVLTRHAEGYQAILCHPLTRP